MRYQDYIKANYNSVVEMYRPHCHFPRLLSTLLHGPDAYCISVLNDFLLKINFQIPAPVTASLPPPEPIIDLPLAVDAETKEQTVPAPIPTPNIGGLQVRELVIQYRQQMAPLYQKRSALQRTLEAPQTNEARAIIAAEILKLTVDIDVLKAREDYYLANGQEMETPKAKTNPKKQGIQVDETNPGKLNQRVISLKKCISRDRKQKPKNVPRWEAEIKLIEALPIYQDFIKSLK